MSFNFVFDDFFSSSEKWYVLNFLVDFEVFEGFLFANESSSERLGIEVSRSTDWSASNISGFFVKVLFYAFAFFSVSLCNDFL